MTWDDQFLMWRDATQSDSLDDAAERIILVATRKAARGRGELDSPEGWAWVERALQHPEHQWFVAAVFRKQSVPRKLAQLMLVAGVREKNPSTNRNFIEPAVKALGPSQVLEALAGYLKEGSASEKGGAASAAYWVRGEIEDLRFAQARADFRDAMIIEFVRCDDVDVRKRILPSLSMQPSDYSAEVRPLVAKAIQIARSHSDEYIRHRIEIQLGSSQPLQPLR